ncbi:hypothetical protein [Xylophilus sp. GOD-11R]|uniref:hypothetical protein n=1 Tax=Xylophilus sp. GOD-11R TaxID=3089814 RepID=UPI00298CF573|nr:hypothetical protein [Xylophilus sp. GOD-11R]WPB57563.1 hypothetical protein R9X41_02580 [Xylophilus sp. GOD-11R]
MKPVRIQAVIATLAGQANPPPRPSLQGLVCRVHFFNVAPQQRGSAWQQGDHGRDVRRSHLLQVRHAVMVRMLRMKRLAITMAPPNPETQ